MSRILRNASCNLSSGTFGIQILQLGLQPLEKKNLLVVRALCRRFSGRNNQS